MSQGFERECCVAVAAVFACPDETAQAIGARATRRRFAARATVVWQGDACPETYLLIGGHARAVMLAETGQQIRLHDYGPHDLFGNLGIADALPVASVVAVTALDTAMFPPAVFLRLFETYTCIGIAVSRMLIARLNEAAAQVYRRSILSAQGRVCAELLRLAEGRRDGAIRPPPVLATLASQVLSTRETVSRTVSMLERRGIVRREPGGLLIVAPRQLRDLIV